MFGKEVGTENRNLLNQYSTAEKGCPLSFSHLRGRALVLLGARLLLRSLRAAQRAHLLLGAGLRSRNLDKIARSYEIFRKIAKDSDEMLLKC